VTEQEEAVRIANGILDTRYGFIDPDGDECILARQFLRAIERETMTRCTVPPIEGMNEHSQ
jgi:hypothetical protein